MANSGRQRTMFIGVVKRARAIEVFPGFGDVSCHKEGTGGYSMPDRQRKCFVLLTREREKLAREFERRAAVKCCKVPDPDAVKYRKQRERVLRWLPKRLCPLDYHPCEFECGLGLGRPIALRLHQRV